MEKNIKNKILKELFLKKCKKTNATAIEAVACYQEGTNPPLHPA